MSSARRRTTTPPSVPALPTIPGLVLATPEHLASLVRSAVAEVLEQRDGASVPERPAFVKKPEMARIMGISLRKLQALTAEGLPSYLIGTQERRYDVAEVLAWLRARSGSNGSLPPS